MPENDRFRHAITIAITMVAAITIVVTVSIVVNTTITKPSMADTMATGSDSGCLPRSEGAASVQQEAYMTEPYFIT